MTDMGNKRHRKAWAQMQKCVLAQPTRIHRSGGHATCLSIPVLSEGHGFAWGEVSKYAGVYLFHGSSSLGSNPCEFNHRFY